MATPNPTSVVEAKEALAAGTYTATQLTEATLARIADCEPALNAFIEVLPEEALAAAEQRDVERASGSVQGVLHGIPIAIKDLICAKEGHTTAASNMLRTFKAPYDATVIRRLKAAGAIIVGKTNLDEFAMGSSTEYSAWGVVHNPWDTTRVAGGSSGGSGAAVAGGEVLLSLGTDTGGSIRLPASFCGVVGIKPTYGRVSRFGVIAYGSSLDQVGPFARTVKDAALLLEVLAGHDPLDATSSEEPVPSYSAACGQDITGMKIGLPREFFAEGVRAEVATVVREAIASLAERGAVITEISLPLTPAAIAVYYLIAKAEASTNLARFDALRFAPMALQTQTLLEHYLTARGTGFGPEVKRAILMGSYALSAGYYDAWYKQASKVRTLIIKEYEAAFSEVDVIAGPVAPEPAFPIGSKADDPLAMYLADALTVPISVAGVPALSVPCGFVDGLPVGLQLAGARWQEDKIIAVAHAYEQAHEWHKKLKIEN